MPGPHLHLTPPLKVSSLGPAARLRSYPNISGLAFGPFPPGALPTLFPSPPDPSNAPAPPCRGVMPASRGGPRAHWNTPYGEIQASLAWVPNSRSMEKRGTVLGRRGGVWACGQVGSSRRDSSLPNCQTRCASQATRRVVSFFFSAPEARLRHPEVTGIWSRGGRTSLTGGGVRRYEASTMDG